MGAIIALAGAMATTIIAADVVKGDRRVYAEIDSAFKKLLALRGYRFHQTLYRGATLINEATFEIVPPHSFHVTSRMSPTIKFEMWKTGTQSRSRIIERDIPGRWECREVPLSPRLDENLTGDIEVEPARNSFIDGLPAREYHYSVRVLEKGQQLRHRAALWVPIKTGLPREFIVTFDDGKQMIRDFYDFGATISIQVPQCS